VAWLYPCPAIAASVKPARIVGVMQATSTVILIEQFVSAMHPAAV
jgi:hypothetical protein